MPWAPPASWESASWRFGGRAARKRPPKRCRPSTAKSTSALTMNSAISTDNERDQSLQPWQFFVLVALACATAVTFLVRGQGLTAVILLTVLMGAAALVGLATLRTV